jgi:hypothetical protein
MHGPEFFTQCRIYFDIPEKFADTFFLKKGSTEPVTPHTQILMAPQQGENHEPCFCFFATALMH